MEVKDGQFNNFKMRRLKKFPSRKIVNVIMFIIWIYYVFVFQFWEKLLSSL